MIKKIKILIVTMFLTAFGGVTYADFQDGYDAYNKSDYKTALREWQPLADQGDADAQFLLGRMYDTGRGLLKDYKQAEKWYRKAADQGNVLAQYSLGLMYYTGVGAPKNYKQAVKWYQKAADQGYAMGQNNLGWMYANGEGVLKDMTKAKYWIKKAYEGNDTAASNLAKENWERFELWKY